MKIKELIKSIENWAHPSLQESYDNSGLQCGDINQELNKALLTLDITEEVVQEASEKGCNLIIAHHPVIFKPLKSLSGKNEVERVVIKAIKKDIVLYAIHTNLDNWKTGINKMLADKIGLVNQQILAPKAGNLLKLEFFVPVNDADSVVEALSDAGAGNIGEYKECSWEVIGQGTFTPTEKASPTIGSALKKEFVEEKKVEVVLPSYAKNNVISALKEFHPYEEVAYFIFKTDNENQETGSGMIGELPEELNTEDFMDAVRKPLNLYGIRHTKKTKEKIKKVAVCGGAGSFLTQKAISSGADVFISSDFKYHDFFMAEDKIMILDIGHYESEIGFTEHMKSHLTEKFPNIAVILTEVNTNPVIYRF